jgi:hypothetical protein
MVLVIVVISLLIDDDDLDRACSDPSGYTEDIIRCDDAGTCNHARVRSWTMRKTSSYRRGRDEKICRHSMKFDDGVAASVRRASVDKDRLRQDRRAGY